MPPIPDEPSRETGMKLKLRFLLAGMFVTAGFVCIFMDFGGSILLMLFLFLAGILGTPSGYWQNSTYFFPTWKNPDDFKTLSVFFALVLFLLLAREIPKDRFEALLREWYFTGPLWLLSLSVLATRYAEEKQKREQQQKTAPDGSSSAG